MGGCRTDKLSPSQQKICEALSKQCDATAADAGASKSSFTVANGQEFKKYTFKNANICHVAALGYAINQPKEAPAQEVADPLMGYLSENKLMVIRIYWDRKMLVEFYTSGDYDNNILSCPIKGEDHKIPESGFAADSISSCSRFPLDGSIHAVMPISDDRLETIRPRLLERLGSAVPAINFYHSVRDEVYAKVYHDIVVEMEKFDEALKGVHGANEKDVRARAGKLLDDASNKIGGIFKNAVGDFSGTVQNSLIYGVIFRPMLCVEKASDGSDMYAIYHGMSDIPSLELVLINEDNNARVTVKMGGVGLPRSSIEINGVENMIISVGDDNFSAPLKK